MAFRVATWNVESAAGGDRNARRLELIQGADAEIVVLTETHDELALSDYEAASTMQRPAARQGARWTTIWSRRAVRRRIETADPLRTVAVELEAICSSTAQFCLGTRTPDPPEARRSTGPSSGASCQSRAPSGVHCESSTQSTP